MTDSNQSDGGVPPVLGAARLFAAADISGGTDLFQLVIDEKSPEFESGAARIQEKRDALEDVVEDYK